MVDGDYTPLWTLEMADKDAQLMQAAAKATRCRSSTRSRHARARAIARNLGDRDLGAIAAT